jgi:hypothetical protein
MLSNAGIETRCGKKSPQFLRGNKSLDQETSHADITRDPAGIDCRRRGADCAGAGENFQYPATERTPVASSGCYSSQQNADGSWTERPCQELGQPAPPAPHKSAARNVEPATH